MNSRRWSQDDISRYQVLHSARELLREGIIAVLANGDVVSRKIEYSARGMPLIIDTITPPDDAAVAQTSALS